MKPHPTHLAQPNRRQRMLNALKVGPLTAERLAAAADTSYVDIGEALRPLLADGSVVLLGTARELGIKSRMDARIYALPGTPKPAPTPKPTKAKQSALGPYANRGTHYTRPRLEVGRRDRMTKAQSLVLSAVQKGHSQTSAIAAFTTLTPREVRNLLLDLENDKLVIRCGESWHPTR